MNLFRFFCGNSILIGFCWVYLKVVWGTSVLWFSRSWIARDGSNTSIYLDILFVFHLAPFGETPFGRDSVFFSLLDKGLFDQTSMYYIDKKGFLHSLYWMYTYRCPINPNRVVLMAK